MTKITSPSLKQKLNRELLQIEKDLQKSYKSTAMHIEGKAIEAIRTNPKYFYSYAKKKSKNTSKIGPLLNPNNKLTGNNKEMADLL